MEKSENQSYRAIHKEEIDFLLEYHKYFGHITMTLYKLFIDKNLKFNAYKDQFDVELCIIGFEFFEPNIFERNYYKLLDDINDVNVQRAIITNLIYFAKLCNYILDFISTIELSGICNDEKDLFYDVTNVLGYISDLVYNKGRERMLVY